MLGPNSLQKRFYFILFYFLYKGWCTIYRTLKVTLSLICIHLNVGTTGPFIMNQNEWHPKKYSLWLSYVAPGVTYEKSHFSVI